MSFCPRPGNRVPDVKGGSGSKRTKTVLEFDGINEISLCGPSKRGNRQIATTSLYYNRVIQWRTELHCRGFGNYNEELGDLGDNITIYIRAIFSQYKI